MCIRDRLGVDLSFVRQEDLDLIKEYTVDWIGDNIYARKLVKPYEFGETQMVVNNDPRQSQALEGVTDVYKRQ